MENTEVVDREKLVTDNINLIYHVMKKMGILSQQDEYYDAGVIGLIRAAKKYDPSTGYKFSSLAAKYIKHQILREIQERKTSNRRINYETVSLDYVVSTYKGVDTTLGDFAADPFDIEEFMMHKEKIESVVKAIYTLKEKDRRIIKYHICDHMNYKEIAEKLNCSRSAISMRMKKIIEKLKKELNEERGDK